MPHPKTALGLDVGEQRIGLAIARAGSQLPVPLLTLPNNETFLSRLETIIHDEDVEILVVGLPRGLDGQETRQTSNVRNFSTNLEQFNLPISFQDEALTSYHADLELRARHKPYTKADIDALSATYILEDYMAEKAN